MGITFVNPVANRPVVVERGKHMSNLLEDVVDADDIEIGFLLPSKGGIGEVLGRGR